MTNIISRPGDPHIINLQRNSVFPGVYDPQGRKISLHLDQENRLYYYLIKDGLISDPIYVSTMSEGELITSRNHTSQVNIGCIKKGDVITKGSTLDDVLFQMLEKNDLIPIYPEGEIKLTGTDEGNMIEVTLSGDLVQVTPTLYVSSPGFKNSDGEIKSIPDFEYTELSGTGTLEIPTNKESKYTAEFTFKPNKIYAASEYGMGIIVNGEIIPSEAKILDTPISITKDILVSYKWHFVILDNVIPQNITYKQIMEASGRISGWINQQGDTVVKDTLTIEPGKCAVIMCPNFMKFSAKKLGTTVEWNSIEAISGNSQMMIYYINVLPSGRDSEYTNLKIYR